MLIRAAIFGFFRYIFEICPYAWCFKVLRQKWRLWKEEKTVGRYTLYLIFTKFHQSISKLKFFTEKVSLFIYEYPL